MRALEIENLEKTYENGFVALKGVSFNIEKGDFFALLGPNGAGKSTTIGILTSLINKTKGKVKIFGMDLDSNFTKIKKLIGVVPQEFNFGIWEPIIEVIINQGGYYGIERSVAKKRAEKLLKELDLYDKRYEIGQNLSGGMKRRLMIARALIHKPKLLILDEPTAGVDIEIRRSMWKFIEKLNRDGTTIILTTHYLEEAENLCKNVAIINNGEIVENTSIKKLLNKLDSQTFVLDLKKPIKSFESKLYNVNLVDPTTLEVEIKKGESLNSLFDELSKKKIEVLSLKNKTNRLEELFLKLIDCGEVKK